MRLYIIFKKYENKMVNKKNKWFTILEMVIAISISLVVILIISYLIEEIENKITSSQDKSKIYIWINDLIEKVNSKKNLYSIPKILESDTWSYNVLLLTNKLKSSWLLMWVVDKDSLKLDSTWSYNVYWNKVLAIKLINKFQLDSINSDTWSIYSFDFHEDELFPDLSMKSLNLATFNSWSIIEANFSFFENYDSQYKWKPISETPFIQNYDLTLDF